MKILWIVFIWPEITSSAAGLRTTQLLAACQDAGHEVRVTSSCQDNKYRTALESQGITTAQYLPNDSSFEDYLKMYNPDVVFFDRFMIEEQFGWRVRETLPNAVRILDTIDLHALRRARQRKVEAGLDATTLISEDFLAEDFLREISSIYRSDFTLLTSDAEAQLLKKRFNIPSTSLGVFRFFYDTPKISPPFDARLNFVTIGNFNHPPNTDSFRILLQEVWPRIQELFIGQRLSPPELHIYGAYPIQEFLQINQKSAGVRVLGWTEDSVSTLQQYRVNLAPLRFGAGIKGKISDGFAAGTPCVTTAVGAEGMTRNELGEDLPFGGAVAESWDQFAQQAVGLYLDPFKWQSAQLAGYSIIAQCFNRSLQIGKFVNLLNSIVESNADRRRDNFIGAMLWHHAHRSTEFFSRWIEAKNKIPT